MDIPESDRLINRREAILRVSAMLGGTALVGGSGIVAALGRTQTAQSEPSAAFTAADIALLDEIAETILPETKTPGAKAANTGAFMALMVTDCYSPREQQVFREGMRKLQEACIRASKVRFTAATPEQRLAVLRVLDHEQKQVMDSREAAQRQRQGLAPAGDTGAKPDAFLPDQRKQRVPDAAVGGEENIKEPAHYFRMMKELTLLGYFTSEIGCTQAQHFVETPGRYDPCVPYANGSPAWANHA